MQSQWMQKKKDFLIDFHFIHACLSVSVAITFYISWSFEHLKKFFYVTGFV